MDIGPFLVHVSYILPKMQVGRRFRLYPSPEQAAALRRWMIGAQRFVYNAKIDEYRYEDWLRRHAILSPSWEESDPQRISLFNQAYSHFPRHQPVDGGNPRRGLPQRLLPLPQSGCRHGRRGGRTLDQTPWRHPKRGLDPRTLQHPGRVPAHRLPQDGFGFRRVGRPPRVRRSKHDLDQ